MAVSYTHLVTLCGDEERIKAELEKYRYDVARVDILHAPEIISCDEQPTFAIRKKKDLSLIHISLLPPRRSPHASRYLPSLSPSPATLYPRATAAGARQPSP